MYSPKLPRTNVSSSLPRRLNPGVVKACRTNDGPQLRCSCLKDSKSDRWLSHLGKLYPLAFCARGPLRFECAGAVAARRLVWGRPAEDVGLALTGRRSRGLSPLFAGVLRCLSLSPAPNAPAATCCSAACSWVWVSLGVSVASSFVGFRTFANAFSRSNTELHKHC